MKETPIEKLDLVTSVELVNTQTKTRKGIKPKDCYHFLYGSQLYGTFFAVFGRFEAEQAEEDAKEIQITGLKLRLFNYSGLLNIGFTEDNPSYDVKKKGIYFGVRGGSIELEKTVAMNIVVKKGKRFRLKFNRILHPIPGYGQGRGPGDRLPAPSEGVPIFDTEFDYRSGIDHFPQARRDGMVRRNKKGKIGPFAPNHRCLTSVVNLLF